MSGYIPQDTFNLCAVATALLSVFQNNPPSTVVSEVVATYESLYKDKNLRSDVLLAATQILEYFGKSVPADSLRDMLLLMEYCAVNYEPSGRKKRKKLFGGTLFVKERVPLYDKVHVCAGHIIAYHYHIKSGVIKYDGKWTP